MKLAQSNLNNFPDGDGEEKDGGDDEDGVGNP